MRRRRQIRSSPPSRCGKESIARRQVELHTHARYFDMAARRRATCERSRPVPLLTSLARGPAMKLQQKLKTALDETRLLILGAQILLGFQLNGMFQDAFEQLAFGARLLDALAFLLMTVTIELLIAPAMQHRIVEQGEASQRIHEATTTFAGAALLPLGVSLGLDLAIAFQRHYGAGIAAAAGVLFFALAMLFWFGLEWLRKRDNPSEKVMKRDDEGT